MKVNLSISIIIGLPLDVDVEGPEPNDTYVFVLGARPIAQGKYDRYINASIAGVSIFDEKAASGFASCVVSCLESLTVDTSGTDVSSEDYDVIARRLVLTGSALDSDYEKILQSLVYFSNANSLNVTEITVSYIDNGAIRSAMAAVEVVGNQRRRRSVMSSFTRRHLLSTAEDFDDYESSQEQQSFQVPILVWSLMILVIIVVVMVMIWRRRASPIADL